MQGTPAGASGSLKNRIRMREWKTLLNRRVAREFGREFKASGNLAMQSREKPDCRKASSGLVCPSRFSSKTPSLVRCFALSLHIIARTSRPFHFKLSKENVP